MLGNVKLRESYIALYQFRLAKFVGLSTMQILVPFV